MDMLKDFTRKEEFLKEGIYCENCKEDRLTTYKSSIYKLPEILVIDFKRFKQEEGWEKIYNNILFPVAKLDLSEIVKDSGKCLLMLIINNIFLDDISVEDHVYTLFGVVHHYGTLDCGHYTA
jgi:ubiquitin C-terminal hydrolase